MDQEAQQMFDGSIVAKFSVQRHDTANWPGNVSTTTVVMGAVWDDGVPENQRFAKATPFAELRMGVDDPVALIKLQPGREYYVTFTPVPPPVLPAAAERGTEKIYAPEETSAPRVSRS